MSIAKGNTTIVGLAADSAVRGTVVKLWRQVLSDVSAIPPEAEYRKSVETFARSSIKLMGTA